MVITTRRPAAFSVAAARNLASIELAGGGRPGRRSRSVSIERCTRTSHTRLARSGMLFDFTPAASIVGVMVIRDAAPTDGLWIITLGQFGKLGLASLTLTVILPALVFWKKIPLRFWDHPAVAPGAAMAFMLLLHMVDNLLNGMLNPLFMIGFGGVSAILPNLANTMRRYGEAGAMAQLDQEAGLPSRQQPAGLRALLPARDGQRRVAEPDFVAGAVDTGFIDRKLDVLTDRAQPSPAAIRFCGSSESSPRV